MKEKLVEMEKKVKELFNVLKIEEREKVLTSLELVAANPSFWNDNEKAKVVLKDIDREKRWIDAYNAVSKFIADGFEFLEMLEVEDDSEVKRELESCLESATKGISDLELKKMLGGKDDECNALFEIHPGAGGTESLDWANMILRMYSKYFENKGFESTTLDLQSGEEAGIKSAVLEVRGEYAFGYLKAEIGIHRLVRISPFDSNSRRHTSFASVHVLPIIEDSDDLKLAESDIRVDTYRASGAGGQHVNKTDSAVRMTHLPTNIVAQCQNERSQLKNRESCKKILHARVAQYLREEEEKKRDAQAVEKKKIEWGSQIRSYVLHPYNMVKDHRSGFETSNTGAVLDGDLESFVTEYLLKCS